MVYVFDACALISYLHIEVHYANIRSLGAEQAAAILEKILSIPIKVVSEISDTVFQQTARLKASYKCSLADAIGLATAIERGGVFVTADHHELEAVANKETLNFLWFR